MHDSILLAEAEHLTHKTRVSYSMLSVSGLPFPRMRLDVLPVHVLPPELYVSLQILKNNTYITLTNCQALF